MAPGYFDVCEDPLLISPFNKNIKKKTLDEQRGESSIKNVRNSDLENFYIRHFY